MSDDRVAIPEELAEAFSQHEVAEKIFTTLPPSHQKEYLRWIGEACGDPPTQSCQSSGDDDRQARLVGLFVLIDSVLRRVVADKRSRCFRAPQVSFVKRWCRSGSVPKCWERRCPRRMT